MLVPRPFRKPSVDAVDVSVRDVFKLQHLVRKRATRDDVIRARAARKIVLPINQQIATWQVDAARLRAMSARPLTHGNDILAEVDRLETSINGHLEHLSAVLDASPPGTIEEGRVLDTVRALRSLGSCLDQIRDTLRVAEPRLARHPQTVQASATH